MSMHNAFCLHIIRKNRAMHRTAPASVVPAVSPAAVQAATPAVVADVVPATASHTEHTPR